jgi:peptide/nickel transport system permease protein
MAATGLILKTMARYILTRLVLLVPILLGITLFSFLIINILPGDVAIAMMGADASNINEQALETLRSDLGLDRPLHVQYLSWLGGVLRGDFGTSLALKVEILPEILRRLPVTLELAIFSILLGLLIGVPLGVTAAIRGGVWDGLSRGIVSLGIGVPSFFIATLLLLFVAPHTPWIPTFSFVPFSQDPGKHLLSLLFPAISVGIGMAMTIAENMRSAMLEVLKQDYVTVAYAKGLKRSVVIGRHILKNASIPIISIIGLQMAFVFSGTVIIENIFSIPGLGKLALNGVNLRDYPLVQGVLVFMASAVVLINLVTDLLYSFVDPRIRFQG